MYVLVWCYKIVYLTLSIRKSPTLDVIREQQLFTSFKRTYTINIQQKLIESTLPYLEQNYGNRSFTSACSLSFLANLVRKMRV